MLMHAHTGQHVDRESCLSALSQVLIGARSVVCEGAILESESIIAPGTVVPPARRIPSGELWGGNPARFIRKLTAHEVGMTRFEFSVMYKCGCTFVHMQVWMDKRMIRSYIVRDGIMESDPCSQRVIA